MKFRDKDQPPANKPLDPAKHPPNRLMCPLEQRLDLYDPTVPCSEPAPTDSP